METVQYWLYSQEWDGRMTPSKEQASDLSTFWPTRARVRLQVLWATHRAAKTLTMPAAVFAQ